METVSELASPPPLRIPVLEPEEGQDESTTAGADQAPQDDPLVLLIDPQQLPPDTVVRPAPTSVSVATQTFIHADPKDFILVVPYGGGRLLLE